jgi:hypothetical protein
MFMYCHHDAGQAHKLTTADKSVEKYSGNIGTLIALCPLPSWKTTLCQLFANDFSIYLKLPSFDDLLNEGKAISVTGRGGP